MSKISEQKALEAYPVCEDTDEFNRIYERKAYIQGYDQAMQDFLEKACMFLKNRTMAELCLNSESTEKVH